MIPDWKKIIDSIYPADRQVRGILLSHSRAVADEALAIAARKGLPLDRDEIEAAAMLHDVGIIFTSAPGIDCHGEAHYMMHGVLGADRLRSLGVDEKYARVAERHTGSGLTHDEIIAEGLPLPLDRDYMPRSVLERLICYADCFYSKNGSNDRKPVDRVEASMTKFSPGVLARFKALKEEFE